MIDPDPGRYGRSFADVYDQWYDDQPTDDLVGFVRERVPDGSRLLELGVGTGRVALALADAGYAVIGLDSSAEMTEQLRAKPGGDRVEVIIGDAADATAYPREPVDAVLAVFNLVFNLTSEDAQRACFAAAAGALRPGGVLVVEAFVPEPIAERRRDLVTRSVAPDRVILIATDTQPADQLVHGSHIEITESGTRLRPWTIRMTPPHELDAMASAAGLTLVERLEDVCGRPYVIGESTRHVTVYRRPDAP